MARVRSVTSALIALGMGLVATAPTATASPVAFEVEEPVAETLGELWVPWVTQQGEITNCGPTAAAMLLAAYRGIGDERELVAIRDLLGNWSWKQFPLRRFSLPGYDAGMSTPQMLTTALNLFSHGPHFVVDTHHPWLPDEAWAITSLQARVAEGRPVLALVQASTLWQDDSPALHWVVVRGIHRGQVVFNDSADTGRMVIPLDRFWEAWRLDPLYRELPMVGPFTAVVADRPLPWHTSWLDHGGL